MNWFNVKLIFLREVRDQLRDRRTLFTIAVLPLLLYPLLGTSFLQVAQFMHEQPVRVWVVGTANLPASPPALLQANRFHADFCPAKDAKLLELEVEARLPADKEQTARAALAAEKIRSGEYAAVVYFPPSFASSLKAVTDGQRTARKGADNATGVGRRSNSPMPEIVFDRASDKSRLAYERVRRVLSNWRQAIVRGYLTQHSISPAVTEPFVIRGVDVSKEFNRRAAIWSKILPFVVLIWALTGAFYPAIDLCAGEKERGTLETLLSSPAQRNEIVWGKLLTIMLFSMATAILNLLSMGVTGIAIIYFQPTLIPIGPPPISSIGWLLLALVPIAALFSALALAIAAFARSTKEGQYYLMPLLLISLPLMILPMMPSVELNLGTSLIPITGMMLLLRTLVEGQYVEAAIYVPPVIIVTFGCCLLAIRWAVDQFNNESVLFRESEQWSLRLWLRHMIRERGTTPTFAQAIACGVILLTIRFFASFAASTPETWAAFARLQFGTLVFMVGLPAVAMAVLLTRGPQQTLLLKLPRCATVVWAGLLALCLHPAAMWLADGVQRLYPIPDEMLEKMGEFQHIVMAAPSMWHILVLMALVPAICEELAFRGFILSGLRRMGHKWAAIIITSVFFGMTHGILQQSITAALVGIVIGYLAVQTGSLLPGIVFHLIYNSLSLLLGFRLLSVLADAPWLHWLFVIEGESISYRWPVVLIGTLLSAVIFWWFRGLAYAWTAEERLQDALGHQTAPATTS